MKHIGTRRTMLFGSFGLMTALFLCAAMFSACAPEPTEKVSAESVVLSETSVTLTKGETVTLAATVLPEDATDKTVTWSSSDPAVASVEKGKITANDEGSATISAACGEASATAVCTVTPAYAPVDAEEWTAAFALDEYDNFGFTLHIDMGPLSIDAVEYTRAGEKEYFAQRIEGESEIYTQKGTADYTWYGRDVGDPWIVERERPSVYKDQAEQFLFGTGGPFAACVTAYEDFKDSYQTSENCYRGSLTIEDETVNAALWFAEGKLRRLEITQTADGSHATAVFVYGNQTVELPQLKPSVDEPGESIAASKWDGSFAFTDTENWRVSIYSETYYDDGSPASFGEDTIVYATADGKEMLKTPGNFGSEIYYSLADGDQYKIYEQLSSEPEWRLSETRGESLYVIDAGIQGVLDPFIGQFENFTYQAEKGCYTGELVLDGTEHFTIEVYFENEKLRTIDMRSDAARYMFAFTHGGQSIEFPFEI